MPRVDAFFLPLGQGSRFCLMHRPPRAAMVRGAVLFVHPFAEEMNKSRRMAALQARAFADDGWAVLQIDLHGCGDSGGDFGDASWQQWIDDVSRARVWLRAEIGHQPVLWGLRGGCLLVAEALHGMDDPVNVLFWQPVLSGRQSLQQFLRLTVANQILAEMGTERTGTQQIRGQLLEGKTIQVAGYALSPALALSMEGAELKLPKSMGRLAWFEVSGAATPELSPAARTRIEAWGQSGIHIDARVVTGLPFWQTQEIAECPALVDATLDALKGWRD